MRRNLFATHMKEARDNSEGKLLRTKLKMKQIQCLYKMVHVCMVKLVEMHIREAQGHKRSTHFFNFRALTFFFSLSFPSPCALHMREAEGQKREKAIKNRMDKEKTIHVEDTTN